MEDLKLCYYGCGKEATFQFKNGKYCCSRNQSMCSSIKLKSKPKRNSFLGKKHTKESIEKNRSANKLYWNNHPKLKEIKRKYMNENSIYLNKRRVILGRTNKGKCFLSKEFIEKHKLYMLRGGASYANSFIQNPSKPQVELYNRVKELYPTAILNYPLFELNYSLDIAIPELKIWIESDGSWWHQDPKKDLERQIKIESLGWKCIRYKIDYTKDVPNFDQIKKDIKKYEDFL